MAPAGPSGSMNADTASESVAHISGDKRIQPEAAKGTEWARYKHIMVGRILRRPGLNGASEPEDGVVRFPLWERHGFPQDSVYSVRWQCSEGLEHYTFEELKPFLQDSFLESIEDVPIEILELQRNNWYPIKPAVQPPKRQVELKRGRPATEAASPVAGPGGERAPPPAATTAGTKRARTAGEGGNTQQSTKRPTQQAQQDATGTRGASAQAPALVSTDARQSQQRAEKTEAPASRGGHTKTPARGTEQGSPPATYVEEAVRSAQPGTPAGAGAAAVTPTESSPERAQAQQQPSAPLPQQPSLAAMPRSVRPASSESSQRGGTRNARAASTNPADTAMESDLEGSEGGQEDYSDTSKWVKSWTGKYYPRELVYKPGDKRAKDIKLEECDGEFEVECILDQWIVDDEVYYLIKWKRYELRIGTRPRLGGDWTGHAKGDWEPEESIGKTLLKKWKKNKPDWYAAQQ